MSAVRTLFTQLCGSALTLCPTLSSVAAAEYPAYWREVAVIHIVTGRGKLFSYWCSVFRWSDGPSHIDNCEPALSSPAPRYYWQVTNSDGWAKRSNQDKTSSTDLTRRTPYLGSIDIGSILAVDSVHSRLQTGNWSLEPGAGSLLGNLV